MSQDIPDTFEETTFIMQTIGKYFAALVLAILSSFSDSEPAETSVEEESVFEIRIIKASPCANVDSPEYSISYFG